MYLAQGGRLEVGRSPMWDSTCEATCNLCVLLKPKARAEKLQALQNQAPNDAWWLLVQPFTDSKAHHSFVSGLGQRNRRQSHDINLSADWHGGSLAWLPEPQGVAATRAAVYMLCPQATFMSAHSCTMAAHTGHLAHRVLAAPGQPRTSATTRLWSSVL